MGILEVLNQPWWILNSPFNYITMPLVGAFVGWVTNVVAVKLLFLPKKRTFGIQGVIPARKADLAMSIASSSQFLLPKEIEQITKIPIIGEKVINYIEQGVKHKVQAMNNDQLQELVESTIHKELHFIEVSGGYLGFFVGLVQAILIQLIH